jgi:hypothetical protein
VRKLVSPLALRSIFPRKRRAESPDMGCLRPATGLHRLCTIVLFLTYLCAGASFALPAQPNCMRCKHVMPAASVEVGTFCPLVYKKPHCPSQHGQSGKSLKIVVCPQGCCLLHPDLSVVSSVAKFVSSSVVDLGSLPAARRTAEETAFFLAELYLPPLYHPPSVRT